MTKPLSVLLVEDTEDDAILLERVLKQGGYSPKMHRVDCREELQFALQINKWDIITDYNLPGFNFESALRLIHENEIDTPIIIVSGSIGEEAAVRAMKAGANDYVMKDNLTRLSPAIERELREAEIRRQRREAENTIRHLAFYDPLTLLPNRRLLMDRFEHALHTSMRGNSQGALLYIDLDNFKHLNDTKGHQHGDLLLKEIALRLKRCVREEDTVARLGGDEFVVMLENLDTQTDHAIIQAKTIGDKIIMAISQPWHSERRFRTLSFWKYRSHLISWRDRTTEQAVESGGHRHVGCEKGGSQAIEILRPRHAGCLRKTPGLGTRLTSSNRQKTISALLSITSR